MLNSSASALDASALTALLYERLERVRIHRGATRTLAEIEPNSIALDGYVQGPELDLVDNRISFDHHDRCIRLVTAATCEQALDALLLGLDPSGYQILLNDIDGDTVAATFVLLLPELKLHPRLRALVANVGKLDAHGPSYPVSDPELSAAFYEGVMAPERDHRINRTYGEADLGALLEECLLAMVHLVLEGPELVVASGALEPTPYEVVATGTGGWALVASEGFCFKELYAAGVTKAIAYKEQPDGSFAYTVARASDLVAFPVGPMSAPGSILAALAAIEPGWGGGSSIGGAPRNEDGSRSRLTPQQVFELVEAALTQV